MFLECTATLYILLFMNHNNKLNKYIVYDQLKYTQPEKQS